MLLNGLVEWNSNQDAQMKTILDQINIPSNEKSVRSKIISMPSDTILRFSRNSQFIKMTENGSAREPKTVVSIYNVRKSNTKTQKCNAIEKPNNDLNQFQIPYTVHCKQSINCKQSETELNKDKDK